MSGQVSHRFSDRLDLFFRLPLISVLADGREYLKLSLRECTFSAVEYPTAPSFSLIDCQCSQKTNEGYRHVTLGQAWHLLY